MSIKNVKIRFNLEKENNRKAYEYLQNAEKSYSKTIISAICGYMELSEKVTNEKVFLERVVSTIREEIAISNPLGGLLQLVQTPSAQAPIEKESDTETEETVFDFLDNF